MISCAVPQALALRVGFFVQNTKQKPVTGARIALARHVRFCCWQLINALFQPFFFIPVELEQRYGASLQYENVLQSVGSILLVVRWCEFDKFAFAFLTP